MTIFGYILLILLAIPNRVYITLKTIFQYVIARMYIDEFISNTVFVGGFGTFDTSELFSFQYWGIIGEKLLWVPKIAPFSSMDDRARELFYTMVDGSKIYYDPDHGHNHSKYQDKFENRQGRIHLSDEPKENDKVRKIILVGHSSGGPTINRLIELLRCHHAYLVQEGLLPEDTYPNYAKDGVTPKLIFYKERNCNYKPWIITPRFIKRVVYISSPLGGVEYYHRGGFVKSEDKSQDMKPKFMRLWWWFSVILMLYQKCFSSIKTYIYDTHISQFPTISSFVNNNDHIVTGLTPENAKGQTDIALSICKQYSIKTYRIITEASIPVRGFGEMMRPFGTLYLLPFVISSIGYFKDKRNDGVVSVESQLYGMEKCEGCKHRCYKRIWKCKKCKTIYTQYDHLQIVGTFEYSKEVNDLYSEVFDFEPSSSHSKMLKKIKSKSIWKGGCFSKRRCRTSNIEKRENILPLPLPLGKMGDLRKSKSYSHLGDYDDEYDGKYFHFNPECTKREDKGEREDNKKEGKGEREKDEIHKAFNYDSKLNKG